MSSRLQPLIDAGYTWEEIVKRLTPEQLAAHVARERWIQQAVSRDGGLQLLVDPEHKPWNIMLWRAGRGFGKSRSQSEAMWWDRYEYPNTIGHYLGATHSDVLGTLFEGPAGMQAVTPPEVLYKESWDEAFNKSDKVLTFKNGSMVRGFATTEQGNRLRGPQCHFLAGDELAAWNLPAGNLEVAFNNAMYGVRLPYPDGKIARAIFGTTPRPIPFLKRLEKRSDVIVVTGSSYLNLANLSPSFKAQLLANEGTLMGKQEINGDYIDEESDLSIWKRSWINLWPAQKPLPEFMFVIESYDTALAEHNYHVKKQTTDPTASIVLGVFSAAAAFTEDERKKLHIPRLRYGIMLCDAWSERLGFPDLIDRAREQHRIKWGANKKKADVVLIEDKGSGISMRQTLSQHGIPTWPYNPHGESKTMRAHSVAPMLRQGMLFVPESMRPERRGMVRDWVEPFLEQICAFAGPGSVEHDDFVDALSQALLYLKNRDLVVSAPEKPYVDYEEERAAEQRKAQSRQRSDRDRERGNPYG